MSRVSWHGPFNFAMGLMVASPPYRWYFVTAGAIITLSGLAMVVYDLRREL